MSLVHWVVTNMDGELEGQFSSINVSSQLSSFDNYVPPAGYKKTILQHDEYEKIGDSFNRERKIYEKHFNQATSRVREMTEARKKINEAKAKPNKYRERINEDGNLVKEFYDKAGNLDKTEIVEA